MRGAKVSHVISAHAEDEAGGAAAGGVAPPMAEALCDQRSFTLKDQTVRCFALNEPRGVLHWRSLVAGLLDNGYGERQVGPD